MPMINFYGAVSKTAVISLDHINLAQMQYQNDHCVLLHYFTKFHSIQLKSVHEKEANKYFISTDLVISNQIKTTEGGEKW